MSEAPSHIEDPKLFVPGIGAANAARNVVGQILTGQATLFASSAAAQSAFGGWLARVIPRKLLESATWFGIKTLPTGQALASIFMRLGLGVAIKDSSITGDGIASLIGTTVAIGGLAALAPVVGSAGLVTYGIVGCVGAFGGSVVRDINPRFLGMEKGVRYYTDDVMGRFLVDHVPMPAFIQQPASKAAVAFSESVRNFSKWLSSFSDRESGKQKESEPKELGDRNAPGTSNREMLGTLIPNAMPSVLSASLSLRGNLR